MAAYRRVYDSRYLQADCQGPGSAPERSVIEYGLPLPFTPAPASLWPLLVSCDELSMACWRYCGYSALLSCSSLIYDALKRRCCTNRRFSFMNYTSLADAESNCWPYALSDSIGESAHAPLPLAGPGYISATAGSPRCRIDLCFVCLSLAE